MPGSVLWAGLGWMPGPARRAGAGPAEGRAGCPGPGLRDGPVLGAEDRRLEDVVAGVVLLRQRAALGRDRAQPAGLEVLESLDQLGPGVHDERAVGGNRLANRLAAQEQHV